MRWPSARSPVAPGGELSDTALFPWRTGPEAHGTLRDEPVVAVDDLDPARRPWPLSADAALLMARAVVGVVAILRGARVLFDLPHGTGAGPAVTAAGLAAHGFRSTAGLTVALGWSTLVAGVLVLLGVFASFAASALLATATVAVGVALPEAVRAGTTGPVETPALALVVVALVVLAGPGRCAGDAGRPWARAQTPVGFVCLLIGVATGLTVLFTFR